MDRNVRRAAGIAAVSVASCRWLRHSIAAWTATAACTGVASALAYLASVPVGLSSVAALAAGTGTGRGPAQWLCRLRNAIQKPEQFRVMRWLVVFVLP